VLNILTVRLPEWTGKQLLLLELCDSWKHITTGSEIKQNRHGGLRTCTGRRTDGHLRTRWITHSTSVSRQKII